MPEALDVKNKCFIRTVVEKVARDVRDATLNVEQATLYANSSQDISSLKVDLTRFRINMDKVKIGGEQYTFWFFRQFTQNPNLIITYIESKINAITTNEKLIFMFLDQDGMYKAGNKEKNERYWKYFTKFDPIKMAVFCLYFPSKGDMVVAGFQTIGGIIGKFENRRNDLMLQEIYPAVSPKIKFRKQSVLDSAVSAFDKLTNVYYQENDDLKCLNVADPINSCFAFDGSEVPDLQSKLSRISCTTKVD
jgi:hypothetical protein